MCKKLLDKQGAFLPVGAFVSPQGKLAFLAASPKEEQPGAQKVLQLLESGFRGMAAKGALRAAGIAFDTHLKVAPRKEDVGKDAIWMILEEKTGKAQGVVVPYAKSWLGGYTYSKPFVQSEKPRIFVGAN